LFRYQRSWFKVWADNFFVELAGNSALPRACTNIMGIGNFTRREFLKLSSAAVALMFISCDDSGSGSGSNGTREVFKLSLRGRRGSNAAKSHNANHLYRTFEAADADRTHPGDNSRIVTVDLSRERFNELFDNGNTDVADLRDFS